MQHFFGDLLKPGTASDTSKTLMNVAVNFAIGGFF
jgi:hypothetical protein